jgi:hypothetical protein
MVAIVSQHDAHHDRCVAQLAGLQPPLLTTWPVLWLVRRDSAAVQGLFRGFTEGVWLLAPFENDALQWLESFMKKYRRLGAQLADATLVYLAEREEIETVFTLDYREFSVYRYKKNKPLKLIPGF